MWKLKIAEREGPWLTTTNNHVGRQHWEFDHEAGTPQERDQVERYREEFTKNRFQIKQSADLLMRMQLRKENPCGAIPAAIKVKETEDITEEAVTTTLRRAISFYSTIQAHDGHWPAESAGPLFFLPPLVIALYVTGAVNEILSPEHQKEIIRYICNHQVLCLIACYVEDPNSEAYKRHLARIPDYFWLAEDGMKMQSFGCQMWDTAFANQAIIASDLVDEFATTLRKGHDFVKASQSRNGGFPAWEPQRAFSWLEKFNPTEFFEDVLIEREYVECTASAIQGLVLFRQLHPGHRTKEIDSCITRAIKYIEETQNPDGSWYGCWGICYTYGAWFAVEGLVACGRKYHNCPTLQKACKFLISKQLPDGGWGESYLSSANKVYTNLDGNKSNLVQTAWALLSLIDAGQLASTSLHRLPISLFGHRASEVGSKALDLMIRRVEAVIGAQFPPLLHQ
ncbi:hypothetical protein RHSIM_Rhsim03G0270100 [Rhododendron simsii]|uniref:Squalene cyclase C-terminal domain-containing protein n=1 Tax=Rhododendron simsii TaxID=118357 RepID=A0A834H5E1_RHOSS|nr:hypothetical protein RHSIM_Rhsim03G0270100 [Rhododendron simsii]